MPKLTKTKLESILQHELRLKEPVFHLDSVGGRLSGSVISETFKGKRDNERQKLIWDALEQALWPESVKLVGMLLAYTSDEWNLDVDEQATAGKASS